MKSLHKIIAITFIACFLYAVPSFADRALDKKMEKLRKATSEIQSLSGDECDKNAEDIKKELDKARKIVAELESKENELKTKASDARSSSAREKANAEASTVRDSLTTAQQLLKNAMDRLIGLKAAEAIAKELGKTKEVETNTGKKNVLDDLIEEAINAGYKHPCDSSLVRHMVREKIKEQENSNKVKNNGEIRPWYKGVKDNLKEKKLISMAIPNDRYEYIEFDNNRETTLTRFAVEINGNQHFTPSNLAERHLDHPFQQLQEQVYSDPAIFQQLFESLGGEFFIGDLSGEAKPFYEESKSTRSIGLGGQVNFNEKWIAEANVSKAKSELKGIFPVTVFEGFTGQPKTVEGLIQLQMEWLRYALGGGYRSGSGTIRPFATGGVQFLKTKTSNAQGQIDGIIVPQGWHTDTSNFSIGAYGRAGVEIHTGLGLYFTTSISGALEKSKNTVSESATHFVPGVRVGAGWQF